ncbi:MAG TPA: response regulator [Chloroflexota bacterium]|nr:response regulator [Chloroflexota bacterium]
MVKGQGTILVVDDDPMILDFITEALEDDGYQVLTAVGAGALPVAAERQPDCILLDLQMPGMDGEEVSRRLRDQDATAEIPIIVMSAKDRLKATTSRMRINDQLSKPFGLSQLYTVVKRWSGGA